MTDVLTGAGALPQVRRLVTEVPGPRSRELIDLGSGIAVVSVGNAAPRVVEAVQEQVAAFTHACFMVTPYEGYVAVCEELARLTPGEHAKKSALFNSGAEAVENAVKVARVATGRSAVVVFDHAYHGRTNLTMALTAKAMPYKWGFGPFAPEVYRVPMSYPLFVADEVQTGFCRTGDWFACDDESVVPDLVTTAKGIAGGLPLAGLTGRAEVMDAVHGGGLGGTYGGNPVACAAALGAFATMRDLDLVGAARRIEGAMLAVELVRPGTKEPDAELTGRIARPATPGVSSSSPRGPGGTCCASCRRWSSGRICWPRRSTCSTRSSPPRPRPTDTRFSPRGDTLPPRPVVLCPQWGAEHDCPERQFPCGELGRRPTLVRCG